MIQEKSKPRLGFATKIALLFMGIFVAVCGLMLTYSFISYSNLFTQKTEFTVESMVRGKADTIDAWLNTRLAEVSLLADFSEIGTMDWNQQFPILRDQQGKRKDTYEVLYVVDSAGICRQSNGAVSNIADRQYFQNMMNKGQTLISEPVVSKSTGNSIVIALAPIKDAQGKVIGGLGGAVLLDTINQIVTESYVTQSSYAYLIQSDGLVIIHPDRERELNENQLQSSSLSSEHSSIVSKMTQGETGFGYYSEGKTKNLITYTSIPSTGWSLGLVVPTAEINVDIVQLFLIIGVIGAICFVISILAAYISGRKLAKPLQDLTVMSSQVADGDLTRVIDIQTRDEAGQLSDHFNMMVQNLKTLVQQIGEMNRKVVNSTEELAKAAQESGQSSEQVASTIEDLAQGTANEAQMTQDTAQVAIEMSGALTTVEQEASAVYQVAQNFEDVVERGLKAVSVLTEKMDQSVQTTSAVSTTIQDLDYRAQEIEKIVEVITDIAAQTNLLALNAAIEAARAGEQGRGFAVVADEVRKLAEGSAEAAQQIALIIQDIQSSTTSAVDEVNTAQKVIETQAEAVITTQALFQEIETGSQAMDNKIQSALGAMQRMSEYVQKIVRAIEDISAITEESAASTQEISAITEEQTANAQMIASSAQQIAEMVNELDQGISQFKTK